MDIMKHVEALALDFVGADTTVKNIEAHEKIAVNPDTERFIEWAIMRDDKVSRHECAAFLERQGVPHKEYKPARRGNLQRGEMVKINKDKVPGHLQDVLGIYHEAVATIDEVDGDDVVLNFQDPRLPNILRVNGGAKGSKVGLYRHTPASAAQTGPGGEKRAAKLFEVVYISDKTAKPPSAKRIKLVQEYVDRGADKGEKRSRIYYTGLCLSTNDAKSGADKDWHFKIFSQQRDNYPRTLNPSKGQILYLGRIRQRPSGWENEYASWIEASEDE